MEDARGTPHTGRRWRMLREFRSPATVLLVLGVVVVGIPLVVHLVPAQEVEVLGQHLGVGARDPDLTLVGPAQLVQLGSTSYDLRGIQVVGPLRPRLALGPIRTADVPASVLAPGAGAAVQADAVETLLGAALRWYLWGALGVVAVAVAGSGLAGCARVLAAVRRTARPGRPAPSARHLAADLSGSVSRMTVLAVVAGLLGWAACGAAAYHGTVTGIRDVRSLADLVGATRLTPAPVGEPVYGVTGAVIGDSRVARLGGPPLPDASPRDVACGRSTDSAAAELALLRGVRVRNLACTGASVAAGLRGPQRLGDVTVPPQVGLLRQLVGLDWVVVAVGPNDLVWTDFLLYCYALPTCGDRLAEAEFERRLTAFDRRWAALLADLAALDSAPRVVVMTSYAVLPPTPDPTCPAMRGRPDVPGLDQRKADLLAGYQARLNEVLVTGAQRYGFEVARPPLTPLCVPAPDGLGPDLQGITDPHPYHPTATGSLRLAAALSAALARGTGARQAVPVGSD